MVKSLILKLYLSDCTSRYLERLLHDGDGTCKIVEAAAEHDFCLRSPIEMFRVMERKILLVQGDERIPQKRLLTMTSYDAKKFPHSISDTVYHKAIDKHN